MPITLNILKPFIEDKKTVDWVSIECPGGSFVVTSGHRPLVNVLLSDGVIVYREGGQDHEIAIPTEGGVVHVFENQVVLFLHSVVQK